MNHQGSRNVWKALPPTENHPWPFFVAAHQPGLGGVQGQTPVSLPSPLAAAADLAAAGGCSHAKIGPFVL